MSKIRGDTVGGFNTFLADQQAEEGAATVTLFEFASTVESAYRGVAIEAAPELTEETYNPGGQTALHDALTVAIDDTTEFLSRMDVGDRPENVIIVVLTDGRENASETPQDVVRERVEAKQNNNDWEFLFIGANQDAALTAGELGINKQNSLDMAYSDQGTRAAHESVSDIVSEYRQTGDLDGFSQEHRDRQDDATE
jgi:hypothetical protein